MVACQLERLVDAVVGPGQSLHMPFPEPLEQGPYDPGFVEEHCLVTSVLTSAQGTVLVHVVGRTLV